MIAEELKRRRASAERPTRQERKERKPPPPEPSLRWSHKCEMRNASEGRAGKDGKKRTSEPDAHSGNLPSASGAAHGGSQQQQPRLRLVVDPAELDMLRSINRSNYSTGRPSSVMRVDRLRRHEYDDESEEEEEEGPSQRQALSANAASSRTRAQERRSREASSAPAQRQRAASSSTNSKKRSDLHKHEERLEGFRHERITQRARELGRRRPTQSGSGPDSGSGSGLLGLVYDADFDCYYSPHDDQYYRLVG